MLNGDVVPPPPTTDDDVTPPPVASVTPAPATAHPVSPPTPTPGGTLETVGLLPLALGREPVADRFAVKVRSAGCVGVASSTLTKECVFACNAFRLVVDTRRRRTKERFMK